MVLHTYIYIFGIVDDTLCASYKNTSSHNGDHEGKGLAASYSWREHLLYHQLSCVFSFMGFAAAAAGLHDKAMLIADEKQRQVQSQRSLLGLACFAYYSAE